LKLRIQAHPAVSSSAWSNSPVIDVWEMLRLPPVFPSFQRARFLRLFAVKAAPDLASCPRAKPFRGLRCVSRACAAFWAT